MTNKIVSQIKKMSQLRGIVNLSLLCSLVLLGKPVFRVNIHIVALQHCRWIRKFIASSEFLNSPKSADFRGSADFWGLNNIEKLLNTKSV